MPGGRQEPGELLNATLVREFQEEVGLPAIVRELLYVSESFDGDTHFTNFTFRVEALGEPSMPGDSTDRVVEFAWLPRTGISARIEVPVVREPLLAYLDGTLDARYRGYANAGISIDFSERWDERSITCERTSTVRPDTDAP